MIPKTLEFLCVLIALTGQGCDLVLLCILFWWYLCYIIAPGVYQESL